MGSLFSSPIISSRISVSNAGVSVGPAL